MKKIIVAALATVVLSTTLSAAPSRSSDTSVSIFARITHFVRVHVLDLIDPSVPKP